jgi:hypothetical protein
MRKWILFFLFILAIQNRINLSPALAEADDDAIKVKETVSKFLDNLASRDIDSAMQYISPNYSDTRDSDTINYDKLKSELKNNIDTFFKNHTDYSIIGIRFIDLNIQGNQTVVEVRYNWKAFNTDTLKEETGKRRRFVYLTKENNIWSITQWHRSEPP